MATLKKKKAPLTNRKPATKKGENEIGSGKFFHIPVHLISEEPGFNNRLDYGTDEFEQLTQDIKENGIREPMRVVPNPNDKTRFFVREGHRRWGAVELLTKAGHEIKKVPAFISKAETPEESLVRMISSNSGKPHENIEKGLTFSKLVAYGWTVAQISTKTGYTAAQVYFCINLTKLPKKYHLPMAKREISDVLITNAYRSNKDNPEKAEKEIEAAIVRGQKQQEKINKQAKKEALKEGKKTLPKSEIKKVKVTAKHLRNSSASSPSKKFEELIIRCEKKPTIYKPEVVLLISTLWQCATNNGTVDEMAEIIKNFKK